MDYTFDKAAELALRTWYPKDHPLHMEAHHPLGKLLGEWGELLDDYMKFLYKPDYEFNPIDELGDIWYYIRILCYQEDHKPLLGDTDINIYIDRLFARVMQELSIAFLVVCLGQKSALCSALNISYTALCLLAANSNITLDQLTEHNWNKLKPGSERGEQWMKARVSTDYIGGKVSLS